MPSIAELARPLLVLALTVAACGGTLSEHPDQQRHEVLAGDARGDPPQKEGEPRTARSGFTSMLDAALPRWKEEISDQLDYASQLLQPLIGVKLAVESLRDWARTGDPHDALRELVEADKADDVTW